MITFFLGTNALLSAAEILAVLNRLGISYTVHDTTPSLLRLETDKPLPPDVIKILGGTIRITSDISSWPHMPSAEEVLDALPELPTKWTLGIGMVGMSQNVRALGTGLKKAARLRESRLSFIEPRSGHRDHRNTRGKFSHDTRNFRENRSHTSPHHTAPSSLLNAAQIIFHKLTLEPNMELIFLELHGNYILLKTIAVQDITSYEIRDTARPARDARVGLLPPKLAQIMINLALGTRDDSANANGAYSQENPPAIYDPFCGMGTLLQEAWLMGFRSFGSDISGTMIDASQQNIAYLQKHFSVDENLQPTIIQHDVTDPNIPKNISHNNMVVVTEPFLGNPQSRELSPTEAEKFGASVMPLYHQFFMNMKSVLKNGDRILVLFPAPKVRSNGSSAFTPLPRIFLDEVASIGYRKKQLIPKELSPLTEGTPSSKPLIYARPDAFVARELTLWERV